MALLIDFKIGASEFADAYAKVEQSTIRLDGNGNLTFVLAIYESLKSRAAAVPTVIKRDPLTFTVSKEDVAAKGLYKLCYDQVKKLYPESNDAPEVGQAKAPEVTKVTNTGGQVTVEGKKDKNTTLEYFIQGSADITVTDNGKTFSVVTTMQALQTGLYIACKSDTQLISSWVHVTTPEPSV